MLAVDMSLSSAISVVAPSAGTWLLTNHTFTAVASVSGGFVAVLLVLLHIGVASSAAPEPDKID